MEGSEIQTTYFSPFMYILYMLIILAVMIGYYQWSWARKVNNYVKVLVVKPDGTTDTSYAPKEGGFVALKNPHSETTKLWPINKLSAIEMLYPGDGFIPVFLQKKIKTVIVDEEDWEPLLNRGSYSRSVASPDVVEALRGLAEAYPEAGNDLTDLADGLSTAPTRDMVASPSVLGNIMKEKVSEMAVTIAKDTFEKLTAIVEKLRMLPNATILYLGLGLLAILVVVCLVRIFALGSDMDKLQEFQNAADNIQAIKNALGISDPTPAP